MNNFLRYCTSYFVFENFFFVGEKGGKERERVHGIFFLFYSVFFTNLSVLILNIFVFMHGDLPLGSYVSF